jgi:hypothetical protein
VRECNLYSQGVPKYAAVQRFLKSSKIDSNQKRHG